MLTCQPVVHTKSRPLAFFLPGPNTIGRDSHKTLVRLLGSSTGTANPERTRHPTATLLARHGRQPGRRQPAAVRGLRAVPACGLCVVSEQMLSASVNGRCRCPPLHRPAPVAMRALHCDRVPSTCHAHPLQVFNPRGAASGGDGVRGAGLCAGCHTEQLSAPPGNIYHKSVCLCCGRCLRPLSK